jgi:hypothetical protein
MLFLDEVEGSEDETENEAILLKVAVIFQNYISRRVVNPPPNSFLELLVPTTYRSREIQDQSYFTGCPFPSSLILQKG